MDATTEPSTLIEHIADWHTDLTVDRTNRSVRNVALTGPSSKNGYRYTEQALREAAVLYDQKPVFLDHAADKTRPHERSTRDLVGTIINSRFESGRIRGDIRVLDTESGRTFLALSESDAPGVGMSHVVLAQRADADGAVERIHNVVSVDAVVFPATTKTFRESTDPVSESTKTAEIHDAAETGDFATAAATDSQVAEMHCQLQQLLAERDDLLAQLQAIRKREQDDARNRRVEQALDSAGLPGFAVTAEFRRQLLHADDGSRKALIAERRQLLESAWRHLPHSAERQLSVPHNVTDAVFVSAIRRHAT